MIFETIGVGFVVTAAMLAAMIHERRMDVLYGPYIEGCISDHASLVDRFWNSAHAAANGMRWKAQNMAYVASVIVC
jgi:hypothetical protein